MSKLLFIHILFHFFVRISNSFPYKKKKEHQWTKTSKQESFDHTHSSHWLLRVSAAKSSAWQWFSWPTTPTVWSSTTGKNPMEKETSSLCRSTTASWSSATTWGRDPLPSGERLRLGEGLTYTMGDKTTLLRQDVCKINWGDGVLTDCRCNTLHMTHMSVSF